MVSKCLDLIFLRRDPDAIEEVAPGWECQEVAEGNIIVKWIRMTTDNLTMKKKA